MSWSAAHRISELGDQQDLREIPAIVGGDQESRHGIVLAKSIPAKQYGIKTGEPIVSARQKCPDLVIVPPDYSLYVEASRKFVNILKNIAPKVEQYSIDEAWADLTGTRMLYGDPVVLAEEIREDIQKRLGFTVNIGVSSNKLLAKMESDLKKPNMVHTLFPEEIPNKMWPLPVSDMFFVGRSTTRKLHTLGIQTIGQLAKSNPVTLRYHLKKHGKIIWGLANGLDMGSVEPISPANKGYGNSTTVAFDVTDTETAKMVLLSLCETVGARLRADNAHISCVAVSLTDNEFIHTSHQMQLYSQTNVTEEIHRAACRLFDQLWDKRTPIRQIGVHTSRVTSEKIRQYNLFDLDKYERLEKLDKAIDIIRKRYGEDAVMRASFLKSRLNHIEGGVHKDKRTGVTKPI